MRKTPVSWCRNTGTHEKTAGDSFISRLRVCAAVAVFRDFGDLADAGISVGIFAVVEHSHATARWKDGSELGSLPLRMVVLIMAVSFIITTLLGVVMAFKAERSQRVALYCLGSGSGGSGRIGVVSDVGDGTLNAVCPERGGLFVGELNKESDLWNRNRH